MSQVDIAMDGVRKEFAQKFASKEAIDSLEYQVNRKIGDSERGVNGIREEINQVRGMLQQEIMNIGELRTNVFEINTLLDDHQNQILTLQVDVMQRMPDPETLQAAAAAALANSGDPN